MAKSRFVPAIRKSDVLAYASKHSVPCRYDARRGMWQVGSGRYQVEAWSNREALSLCTMAAKHGMVALVLC